MQLIIPIWGSEFIFKNCEDIEIAIEISGKLSQIEQTDWKMLKDQLEFNNINLLRYDELGSIVIKSR